MFGEGAWMELCLIPHRVRTASMSAAQAFDKDDEHELSRATQGKQSHKHQFALYFVLMLKLPNEGRDQ